MLARFRFSKHLCAMCGWSESELEPELGEVVSVALDSQTYESELESKEALSLAVFFQFLFLLAVELCSLLKFLDKLSPLPRPHSCFSLLDYFRLALSPPVQTIEPAAKGRRFNPSMRPFPLLFLTSFNINSSIASKVCKMIPDTSRYHQTGVLGLMDAKSRISLRSNSYVLVSAISFDHMRR